MIRRSRVLAMDQAGSVVVEFALLAPAILTLVLGVLQVGVWMQNYNGLRSAAADAGRHAAVEYQLGHTPTNIQLAIWARDHAISTYLLNSSRLSTDVQDAAAQGIAGVTEKTLTINYTMESFLGIAGVAEVPVSFSRPIFVKAS